MSFSFRDGHISQKSVSVKTYWHTRIEKCDLKKKRFSYSNILSSFKKVIPFHFHIVDCWPQLVECPCVDYHQLNTYHFRSGGHRCHTVSNHPIWFLIINDFFSKLDLLDGHQNFFSSRKSHVVGIIYLNSFFIWWSLHCKKFEQFECEDYNSW